MYRWTARSDLVRNTAVIVLTATSVSAVLLAGFVARQGLLLAFAGILLALGLRGLAILTSKLTRIPQSAALAVVCLLLVGCGAGLFWWLGPRLADELAGISERIPAALERLRGWLSSVGWNRLPSAREVLNSAAQLITPNMLRGAAGFVAAPLILIALGVYVGAQPGWYLKLVSRLMPIGRRDRFFAVLVEAGHALQTWLLARAVCMLEVGILTMAGLAFLGIDLFVALGVLAGLLNFVPNFGPVIAAVPAVLIGFLTGPATALWVIGLYLGVQVVDNYIVTPLLEQRTVSLPPAVGIVSQMMLGLLLGPLGLVLATPLTVVAGVLIHRFYVEDILNDRSEPAEHRCKAAPGEVLPECAASTSTGAGRS